MPILAWHATVLLAFARLDKRHIPGHTQQRSHMFGRSACNFCRDHRCHLCRWCRWRFLFHVVSLSRSTRATERSDTSLRSWLLLHSERWLEIIIL